MERIVITDVAPRDGLQNQPSLVATDDKVALVEALFEAGLPSVEVTAFVSPKAVPQMADAQPVYERVAARLAAGARRASALVPNVRGLERAVAAGVREIAVVLSATETMNRRNINMGLDVATAVCAETLASARSQGIATRAYVAVAWECPFEGPTPVDVVVRLAAAMAEAGAGEVVIADTIGAAGPGQVRARLAELTRTLSADRLGVHFHDTRGMGCANAYAALEAGIRRFDSSTGGIGGCPFAPGAAGNVATEDIALMAEQSGFATGIDFARLVAAVDAAERMLGSPLGGRSIRWLRRRHGAQPASGSSGRR